MPAPFVRGDNLLRCPSTGTVLLFLITDSKYSKVRSGWFLLLPLFINVADMEQPVNRVMPDQLSVKVAAVKFSIPKRSIEDL